VHGHFPIQCGPHFISGRGLGEICSREVTWGHVSGHLGRVPQAPGRIPALSLVVSSGQEYIVLPLHPSAISPYADKTESNGTHTLTRALSPPAPHGRLGVVVNRSGTVAGGFAATLAHCAQLASGRHVTPAPVLRAGAGLARPTRRPARRFVSFSLLRVPVPPAAAPGPPRPRPPTGPAAALPLLAAGRPPGSPPLSREVPAAVPQSPQPHRREAPALARAVTPARPTPTVCRAALSASAAVPRDGPGSPLHRLSDHAREHGCRAILHFPKNRPGGRDLLWRRSVPRLFPIQCGPHFISGRGLGDILDEKSRGIACRPPPRRLAPSPRPSPVPPTDPGLRNRGSQLHW
jgi:hypothetical protein